MWKSCLVALAAMLALSGPAPVAAAPPHAYQEALAQAVRAGEPGVQAYVRKGRSRWLGVAGLALVEDRVVMTRQARLRLASLTKMMTYAVSMQLVEEGKLRLTDRAVDLLPKGALDGVPHAGEITVGQLLDHRSGLYNFNGPDGADFFRDLYAGPDWGSRTWTARELLAYARKPEHPPSGPPGEKVSYSSTGYVVLEMILERAERAPLHEIFRRRLFDPLGMKRAGLEGGDLWVGQIANSYARPDESVGARPTPFGSRRPVRADGLVNLSHGLRFYNGWARGAGAVAASAHDMAAFMDAVTANRLTVLKDQRAEFAAAAGRPKAFFDWNGGTWGVQTTILYAPAQDMTVIVLTNASNAGPGSHEIAKTLLDLARQRG